MSWYECTLGDLITLKRGHDLPNTSRIEGDIPVVSSSGITGYHNEAKAKPPGVVTGRYGTLGEVFYIEQDYWPLNTALYIIDFKDTDPRFSAYFLKNTLKSYKSDKAAVPGVDRNVLHALKVRAPDRGTQERVVEVLSKYDYLIENNKRRIELLEESARQLYKEWFVRYRFPGHEHVKIIDGVPEGWIKDTVANVCSKFIDGDWIETKDQGGEDYRILQISNIGVDAFVETGNLRFISESTFDRLNCSEVRPGDLIIARMPTHIGRAWLVTDMPWKMVTAVDVTIAKNDGTKIDTFYLLHHLNSEQHIARCEAGATGATRPRVARKVMGTLPILVPPLSLQEEFAELAQSSHNIKTNLIRQNEQLARARDILLPKLMSGEIAV